MHEQVNTKEKSFHIHVNLWSKEKTLPSPPNTSHSGEIMSTKNLVLIFSVAFMEALYVRANYYTDFGNREPVWLVDTGPDWGSGGLCPSLDSATGLPSNLYIFNQDPLYDLQGLPLLVGELRI